MTLREFLQIELWSKETTRKCFREIWRITKPVAAVLGVLVLLFGIGFVLEWYWLTGSEKEAGRVALGKVEELERLDENAADGFDATNRQAKALTATAEQRAFTLRDKRTASMLEFYRWELEMDHEDRIREIQIREFVEDKHLEFHSNPQSEKRHRDLQAQKYSSIRSFLHGELN